MTECFLTSCDLKEIPLGKADFSWFTDGLSVKGKNSKCYAGYGVVTFFKVVKKSPLSLATSAQQAKLYAIIWACTLAKRKIVNIYTDSRYALRVAHDFGIL